MTCLSYHFLKRKQKKKIVSGKIFLKLQLTDKKGTETFLTDSYKQLPVYRSSEKELQGQSKATYVVVEEDSDSSPRGVTEINDSDSSDGQKNDTLSEDSLEENCTLPATVDNVKEKLDSTLQENKPQSIQENNLAPEATKDKALQPKKWEIWAGVVLGIFAMLIACYGFLFHLQQTTWIMLFAAFGSTLSALLTAVTNVIKNRENRLALANICAWIGIILSILVVLYFSTLACFQGTRPHLYFVCLCLGCVICDVGVLSTVGKVHSYSNLLHICTLNLLHYNLS